MRKVVVIVLIFLSIIALLLRFGTQPLMKALKLEERAGLRVESNKGAKVTIDGRDVGKTPFQDENLKEGEYLVTLISEEGTVSASPRLVAGQTSWQGFVKLTGGTLTVVNRELATSQAVSSGEVITLEKGKGITVTSNPTSASVFIDSKEIGRTPISVSDISVGEHQFLISKENFLKRSIRASLVEGYSLTLAVDLAIGDVDLTKVPTIPISSSTQVTVKSTPTGFLRVRAQANLNGQEIGRVKPGDSLTLLEEIPNWNRVRLPDGKEGWVSSSYTEKKNP